MGEKRSFSVTLLPVLSYAASMHTALMLFAFREAPIADHGGMLLWWGFLALYNIIISLFLRRPRELRSIVLLSAAVALCQLGVTVWLVPVYPAVTWRLASLGMWAALYYQCASAHLAGVKPEALMVNFETNVLALFASAVVISGDAMSMGVLPHLVAGLLCSMTAMIQLRTQHTRLDGQGERPLTRLLPILLLLGTALAAVLLVVLMSGHAAALLTRFTAWLLQMAKLLANAVGAFFLWLFSLFPEVEGDLEGEAADIPTLPSGTPEGMPESSGVLLYVLIAAFLVGLLLVLMKIWRSVHLQGRRQMRRVSKPVVVQKIGFMDAIVRFFRKVADCVRFELRYLRSRNTPQGLLVWLERKMRRRRMGRGRGESISAFLQRVGDQLTDCGEELKTLARCLDCMYYGDGEPLPIETVRELRRSIRKAMKN